MCLVLLLFTGSFTAISITFSKVFAHSTSTTNSSITNKEISPQVKNFILNQIVHKSRAADMVKQGIVNLNDPIEKYLPASVKVPEFKGHKITLEDLATHTSGLPE
jgi:hypothetical protein